MRRKGQSTFNMMGAIIHGNIRYLLLRKEIQSVFARPCQLCLRFIVHEFSSFLRLKYS